MKAHFRSSFLFSGLPCLDEKLEGEMLAKAEFFAKGECVYESTRFKSALGVIVSGNVRISTSDEENRVILRDMSAGETFGAAALFGAGECYVSKIHAKNACAVVFKQIFAFYMHLHLIRAIRKAIYPEIPYKRKLFGFCYTQTDFACAHGIEDLDTSVSYTFT